LQSADCGFEDGTIRNRQSKIRNQQTPAVVVTSQAQCRLENRTTELCSLGGDFRQLLEVTHMKHLIDAIYENGTFRLIQPDAIGIAAACDKL